MAEVHGLNPTEPPQDAADGLGLKQDFAQAEPVDIYVV